LKPLLGELTTAVTSLLTAVRVTVTAVTSRSQGLPRQLSAYPLSAYPLIIIIIIMLPIKP
jgi:hypothetical protein